MAALENECVTRFEPLPVLDGHYPIIRQFGRSAKHIALVLSPGRTEVFAPVYKEKARCYLLTTS
jgi:hypothetical protein